MAPKRPIDSDSTVLAPRPEMTDDAGHVEEVDSGMVFEDASEELTTSGGRARRERRDNTSDVSLIEARSEMAPAPSLEGFDAPPTNAFGDGPLGDDAYNPPTEVLRLAFSDPGSDPIEDEDEEPVEVKKWKMGADDARGPGGGRPDVFTLPRADLAGTRVDEAAQPGAPPRLDLDELRRTIEEAEKLMRTLKSQLAGMDLEARGTNAQVAAVLHRLGEALAMLKR